MFNWLLAHWRGYWTTAIGVGGMAIHHYQYIPFFRPDWVGEIFGVIAVIGIGMSAVEKYLDF